MTLPFYVHTALYAYLDQDSQYDLVYELEVGEELQLTCKSPSEEIDFYMAGVLPKIANDSVHGDIFPGSHPIVTAVSEHRDDLEPGHVMFEKSLKLTVNVGLNGTALQCGARGFDSDAGRIVWAYSRAVLLRGRLGLCDKAFPAKHNNMYTFISSSLCILSVEDDGGKSTSSGIPIHLLFVLLCFTVQAIYIYIFIVHIQLNLLLLTYGWSTMVND